MFLGVSLDEKMKNIEEFFDNLSLDDFEKMSFDAGLGSIADSGKSTYVLASMQYVNKAKDMKNTDNNKFSLEKNDLRGAA